MTTTSNIGLGSLSTSTSGSSSLGSTLYGVDVDTLIDNLVTARSVPNTLRQDKIDQNTLKLSAYSDLQTKFTTLKTAVDKLSNPSVISGVDDIFDSMQTLSSTNNSVDASDLYGVSVDSSAQAGSHSVVINRIASKDTITGTVSFADTTTTKPLSTSDTLTINGQAIALTSTMTLGQIKDAINNKSSTTNVQASIVQASAGSYYMVLKSSVTGKAITLADGTTGSTLAALGLAQSGKTDTSLSAEVVLDGVTVTRSTNSLNDLIDGVSIELYQADPSTTITMTVSTDLTGIRDAVSSVLQAYNDIVDYVKTQRAVGADGSVGEDQVLFNDNVLQSAYRTLQSIFASGASGTSSGTLQGLAEIGIEMDQNGSLQVKDSTKFEDALLGNLDELKSLFGYSYNESTGLSVVDRPSTVNSDLLGKQITVNVTATDTNGYPTAAEFVVNGVTTAATISSGLIKGAAGTEFEGFVVGYNGGALASGSTYTGTFTPTQGIADQASVFLDSVLDSTSGTLTIAKEQLTDNNTRLQDQITTLTNQMTIYRARLVTQFQAAQNMISALESQKSSITSFMDSLNSSN